VTVVVRRACADAEDARRLERAIAVDNPAHVEATVEGSTLVLRVAPSTAASVRATLDDLLRGVAAAEGAARSGKPRPPSGAGG
jgi:hypothetical protein